METYTIKITGEDLRQIIPGINTLLERERARLRKKGFNFEVDRSLNPSKIEEKENKDIQSDLP